MGCFPRDRKGQVVVSADRGAQTLLVDATRAQCASWYWNSVQEQYGSKGFTGWWLDNQAPAIPAASFFLSAGVAAEVLNYYPSAFARALYEGHRKDRTDRCWILSDAAFTGTQRFGASFRLPDARPVWEELRRQVASGLSVAASGFPFWSTEIGGPAAGRDPADFPELFVRWVEFGAFCPTFKMHESRRGDIGTYGAAVEGAAAKFLRLRYRLLPYIYSQARAAAESGAPFTRPLFMDFPQDSEARDLVDEYMFGPAFLVAPVLEGSAALREVYLPAGTSWYDFWTGKKFAGGQWVSADATLAVLPLFVRAGSIIPLGNEITSSRAAQRDVELRVYAGADGRFDLYQDDGTSYEYEQGKFSLAQIRWSDASQKISVSGDDRKLLARPQSEWLRVVK
jgi:alpha-D-xyloside xylohydrolase